MNVEVILRALEHYCKQHKQLNLDSKATKEHIAKWISDFIVEDFNQSQMNELDDEYEKISKYKNNHRC